jgi:hypothetical protein
MTMRVFQCSSKWPHLFIVVDYLKKITFSEKLKNFYLFQLKCTNAINCIINAFNGIKC